MHKSPEVVGVDVGGGGIRLRSGSGSDAADSAAVPRVRGHIDLTRLAERIAVLVGSTADRVHTMAIGMTGLPGLVDDPGLLWHALRDRLGLTALVVAGDALTSHVGALRFQPGIVVAAGTGVMTIGTDLDRVWNRADGWGHLLGDHGSGAWIGMSGLQSALRAHDGRGGSAVLLGHLTERYGDPLDLVARVYEAESPAHELASFARPVAAAARAGDPIARSIWHEAGRQLGETAIAAATGLEPVFSWGGRLFDAADLVLEPFQETIRRRLPEARFVAPDGDSAAGALALAVAAAAEPIRPRPPYLHAFADQLKV